VLVCQFTEFSDWSDMQLNMNNTFAYVVLGLLVVV